jgi:hypothetical protein
MRRWQLLDLHKTLNTTIAGVAEMLNVSYPTAYRLVAKGGTVTQPVQRLSDLLVWLYGNNLLPIVMGDLWDAPSTGSDLLEWRRDELQVSQGKISHYMGVIRHTYIQWEYGKRGIVGSTARLIQIIDWLHRYSYLELFEQQVVKKHTQPTVITTASQLTE